MGIYRSEHPAYPSPKPKRRVGGQLVSAPLVISLGSIRRAAFCQNSVAFAILP